MKRLNLLRLFIFLATTVGAWGLLSLGASDGTPLEPGQLASRDYEARQAASVINVEATELLRDEAAAAVEDVYTNDTEAVEAAVMDLNGVLASVVDGVADASLPAPEYLVPDAAAPPETTAA
ncbi:MAG TPA: hypothetical protein VIA81_02050, partial [Acidimicrobiia bacterium]